MVKTYLRTSVIISIFFSNTRAIVRMYLETFAYALLKNHFHLLVYVKQDVKVIKHNGQGTIQLNASKQLSHFFKSYAQSINKSVERTGPLFESPFERRSIDDNSYFTSMVQYCHHNPELHGFVKDFKEY